MTPATPAPAAHVLPRTPPREAAAVDAAELDALLALLRQLDGEEWELSTDCALWTVRDMVAHMVGATEEMVNPATWGRHAVASHRRYPAMTRLDALNQLQVDDRRHLTGPELVEKLTALVPARLRTRRRVPGWARHLPAPRGFSLPPGTRMGYLFEVITIRDVWMHRVDISVATGRAMVHGDHDTEVVRQVVADLGRSWEGPPLELCLQGPAGGRWTLGQGSAHAEVHADTVDYLRCLAGRNDRPALEVHGDTAARAAATAARVVF